MRPATDELIPDDRTDGDLAIALILLGDADPDVRLRAAVDLGTWRATEAAAALVRRLGVEPSHAIRETLTWALLRMPDAARPLLFEALGDDNWLIRMQACHVLSKLGGPADAERLLPVIADPVDAVASRAWWAAGQTRSAVVVEALVGQLGRGDSELRNSLAIAFEVLAELGVRALARSLRRSDAAEVREHAADILGLIGSPAAGPAVLILREALDDPDPMVRFSALNALGQLDTAPARDAVRAALDSDDPRLHRLASRLTRRRRRAPRATPAGGAPADGPQRGFEPPARQRSSEASTSSTGERQRPPEGRALAEGVVGAASGVLVALGCGTATVAESRSLPALAAQLAELAASRPELDRTGLLAAAWPDGTRVGEALDRLSAQAGEAIAVVAIERLEGRCEARLQLVDGVPRIGVLIGHTGEPGPETDRILAKLVQQVALCAPQHVRLADVPERVWAELGEAALLRARADGLPESLDARIVAGAAADHATSAVLLEQVSVTDPGMTIDALLYGRGIRVTAVRRLAFGDGPR